MTPCRTGAKRLRNQASSTSCKARLCYSEPMTSVAAMEPIPLSNAGDGVIHIAGTRVTLDTVIDTFRTGASPEEIAQDFPALRLDDIYAVLTYYLRHRDEVEAYLRE